MGFLIFYMFTVVYINKVNVINLPHPCVTSILKVWFLIQCLVTLTDCAPHIILLSVIVYLYVYSSSCTKCTWSKTEIRTFLVEMQIVSMNWSWYFLKLLLSRPSNMDLLLCNDWPIRISHVRDRDTRGRYMRVWIPCITKRWIRICKVQSNRTLIWMVYPQIRRQFGRDTFWPIDLWCDAGRGWWGLILFSSSPIQ